MSEEYRIEVKVLDKDIKSVAMEIKDMLLKSEDVKLKGGVSVKSLQISEAKVDSSWKYFITYYPSTGDITVTIKRFERQPSSYAILKVTDKILDVEDLDGFIEKLAKIYLTLRYLREELIGKERVGRREVKSFF